MSWDVQMTDRCRGVGVESQCREAVHDRFSLKRSLGGSTEHSGVLMGHMLVDGVLVIPLFDEHQPMRLVVSDKNVEPTDPRLGPSLLGQGSKRCSGMFGRFGAKVEEHNDLNTHGSTNPFQGCTMASAAAQFLQR